MSDPARFQLNHEGEELEVYWDGFCLTVVSGKKFAFAASINDPTVSPTGNISIIFDTELAKRQDA